MAHLVIVSTKDAVMIANKDNIQDFKVITLGLKAESRGEGKFALGEIVLEESITQLIGVMATKLSTSQ